jgi:hypothetical protein
MLYITVKGHSSIIIVLNIQAPTDDKSDDMKDSFYDEPECVSDQFPKYHVKIWLGDLNAKVWKDDIFNPIIRNENLHELSNNKVFIVVNSATSKSLTVKIQCSHITTFIYTLGLLLMGKQPH